MTIHVCVSGRFCPACYQRGLDQFTGSPRLPIDWIDVENSFKDLAASQFDTTEEDRGER